MKRCILSAILVALLFGCDPSSLLEREDDPANDGPVLTTISAIRSGEVDVDEVVTVEEAVITAIIGNGVRYFFVQDGMGSENAGLMVFKNSADSLSLAVGDRVTITGIYKEYNGQSEIVVGSANCITQTGTASLPEIRDITDCSLEEYESYEGMLVEMRDVDVTSVDDGNKVFELAGGVLVDDMMYSPNPFPAVGTHVERIAGVLHYAYGEYRIEPRNAADIVI